MSRLFQDAMKFSGVKVLRDDYKDWAQCHGKRGYANQNFADSVVRRMKEEGGSLALHSYLCEHCFRFHVGKSREIMFPLPTPNKR